MNGRRTSLSIRCVIAAAIGGALGVIGARWVFVGSWLSLVPWGIAGLALGAWCSRLKAAILLGGCYGFALGVAFMVAGYRGSAALLTRMPFFGIIGLICAMFGIGLTVVGSLISRQRKTVVS